MFLSSPFPFSAPLPKSQQSFLFRFASFLCEALSEQDCHFESLAAAQTSHLLPQGSSKAVPSSHPIIHPSNQHLWSCLLQPLPFSPCMKPCTLCCPTCSSQLCSFSYPRLKTTPAKQTDRYPAEESTSRLHTGLQMPY